MNLSQIKNHLSILSEVNFLLPNGKRVPAHFHVTEIGLINKHFIDCEGTIRHQKVVNFQLWNANDLEHRLKPQKLLNIISLSERKLGIENLEIEVEYQTDTIGKYGLEFNGADFLLTTLQTDCLAKENCGISNENKIEILTQNESAACCTPGGGCC